jgi:hypothetical protein
MCPRWTEKYSYYHNSKREKAMIVFKGFGYLAVLAGLKAHSGPILAVTRNGKGKFLTGTEAKEWADHLKTAIDSKEAAQLCKAIYNA